MAEKRKICVVIGSVPVGENPFEGRDRNKYFVICADGGYDNAVKFGIVPDLLIGDFDSVRSSLPDGVQTIRLKVEKDETDTMAAVEEGMKCGCREFELYGIIGGERFDHSFASLCTLQYISTQGCKAVIISDKLRIFLLNGGKLMLKSIKGSTVSVFPFGCASCEVSYSGLKYPLEHARLYSENALGVSNCACSDNAEVIVHSGNALIMVQK